MIESDHQSAPLPLLLLPPATLSLPSEEEEEEEEEKKVEEEEEATTERGHVVVGDESEPSCVCEREICEGRGGRKERIRGKSDVTKGRR